jgi:hypothetical protein
VQRRRMVGLQHCAQPGFGGVLNLDETFPVPRDRLQLGQHRGRLGQRSPMVMLVSQGVGEDERVEGIRLRRSEPVALPGPGRDLRRDAEDLDAEAVEMFDEEALGALDRDPDPSATAGDHLGERRQALEVMGDSSLLQPLPGVVDQADLVEAAAPVDTDEHLAGSGV